MDRVKKNQPFKFDLFLILIGILDFVCFQTALILGYYFWVTYPWHGNYQFFSEYSRILWILPPIGIFIFKTVGLYKPQAGVLGVEEQSSIFKAIWIIYLVVFGISFFYRDVRFSRLATFYSIFIAITMISFERFLVRRFYDWLHHKQIGIRQAIIYGAGYHGQRLERWIRQSPKLGIRVLGYLDDDIDRLTKKPVHPPFLGKLDQLEKIAKKNNISVVYIAHRKLEEAKIIDIFQHCRELNIQCWVIPSLYQFNIEKAVLSNIGGIPLVSFRQEFRRRPYAFIKRLLDLILGSLLFVLMLPAAFMIAIGIKLTSKGPVFFKQMRVGLAGKKFVMVKFRTLPLKSSKHAVSPELEDNAKIAESSFASFLRKSGLDEIPQLWNVVKGEMSIIGPRPEMAFLVQQYGPLERERLTIKPGITGLWQISEDRKRILIHENMDYDLYYVEHLSFNLDLAILLKTVFVVLKRAIS